MTKPRCVQSDSSDSCCKDSTIYSDLEELVDSFKLKYFCILERELDHYKGISFDEAIKRAAKVEVIANKKHPHQYRIKQTAIYNMSIALQKAHKEQVFFGIDSFEKLHEKVHATISDIHGVGELTVYDTAVRIGVCLGLEPTQVYLHRGTKEGARYLLPKIKNLKKIDKAEFPQALWNLSEDMIESLLCIYKDQLEKLDSV